MGGPVRRQRRWRAAGLCLLLGAAAVHLGAQERIPAPTPVAMKAEPTAKARLAMEGAFSRADLDSDGRLTRAEAVHLPAIEARFDELDTNHDGFLSLEEFIAGAMKLI